MTISMYDTRVMLKALVQQPKVRSWLRDKFFPKIEEHTSEYVDIDIVKGGRKVASYVSPVKEGKVVARDGFNTKTFKAPYVKEKMKTTASDFLKRSAGENVYNAESMASKAQKQVGNDLQLLRERFARLEEVQCAEAMQTGKVTVFGEGVPKAVIDFGMSASHLPVLTGSSKWSDYANSKPLLNLSTWTKLVLKDSGIMPTIGIFGESAMQDFIRNAEVKDLLNNRRINMGQINPTELPNGVKYYGYIDEAGLDIYTYTDWYYDGLSKEDKALIHPDKIILTNPTARTARHYGAIEDLKAGNFIGQQFPKSWETEDPSCRWIMLQSAPLCAPHQIDAFLCAKVR